MHVGGSNFEFDIFVRNASYYYSSLTHVWGWATWKRAWNKYDYRMKDYSQASMSKILKKLFRNSRITNYWIDIFINTLNGTFNTWDYQWQFTLWNYDGISIVPKYNLVSNIGFRLDATHTTEVSSKISNMYRYDLIDLSSPHNKNINISADVKVLKNVYGIQINCFFAISKKTRKYLRFNLFRYLFKRFYS